MRTPRGLADPARAQAILEGDLDAKPTKVRELVSTLHLTEANLLGLDPVATDGDQRAHLDQVIREWVGRHDVALTVKSVLHCGGTAGGCADCPAEIDCSDHPERMVITYASSVRDLETVRRRVDAIGTKEPHIVREGAQWWLSIFEKHFAEVSWRHHIDGLKDNWHAVDPQGNAAFICRRPWCR